MCLVPEPGRSDARCSLFFVKVGQVCFFLLGILGHIRGVPADGEKRVDLVFSQPFNLILLFVTTLANRVDYFFPFLNFVATLANRGYFFFC